MFSRRRVATDAAIVLGLALLAYGVAWSLDLFKLLAEFNRMHAEWRFGEIGALLGLLTVILLIFAASRMKEESRLRRLAEEQLRNFARTDPLTGLMNRKFLDEKLSEEIEAVRGKQERRSALLLIDLRGFKPVADLFGDDAGDELLVQLTERVKPFLSSDMHFARLRGDLFAILMPNIRNLEEPDRLAKHILQELHEPMRAANSDHLIGAAIGIALAPLDADNGNDLLSRAGYASHCARQMGHWSLRFFETGMDAQMHERSRIERALPTAIGTDALAPHYQPIVNLATREIIAFEALARWSHPALGAVSPVLFIAVAEDEGLIRPLTNHLFRRACRDASQWPPHIRLSFNISPKELQDASLARALLGIMAEAGMSPRRLQIEITESALLGDFQSAREVLAMLREAGVAIALDDFGTGRASLNHLRELKIDALKIDKTFVQVNSDETVMILEAILAIAQRLNLTVTAEGVETEEQRIALLERGCVQGQGYLFGRAEPADQVLERLSQEPGPVRPRLPPPRTVIHMRSAPN